MSSFPLRNVLLSAVLASSTVFSALTLPVVLLKPQPIAIELPPFFEGEIQPMFGGENQNLAIPYIGFSIVMSVGAGMTSVEVSRKWQAARQQKQTLVNAVEEVFPIEAIDTEAECFLGDDYVLAASEQACVEIPSETDSGSMWSTALEFSTFNNISNPGINNIWNNALQSPEPYPACHTHMPKLRRRLCCILSQGHSYRLLHAKRTKAKAPEILVNLEHRVDRTTITAAQQGHPVWIWEPNAYSSADLSKVD
jgi:hypothetical protein